MTTDATPGQNPHVLTVASLLPALFEEQKRGDYQAREAVFTTFNADLGFFERTVLGATQATGARVTVLGDADVWAPDARAARNAGTRYLPAVAVHRGAFHPKVNVVVGRSRALVSIGSGNLSPGGWHLNDELWTVARIDADGFPDFVVDVASWLRRLPDVVLMSQEAAAALHRAAADLDSLRGSVELLPTRHRLVHTLDLSIIDQLPDGPVENLDVYAPFHDPSCAALRALIERFTPRTVRVGVQGDAQTSIDPEALADVLAWSRNTHGVTAQILQSPPGRYRHGKLIEATRPDGGRWALTGSPNLSRAALLMPATRGGNIEVGLVTHDAAALFPGGKPISATAVSARPPASPSDTDATVGNPTLLSAVREAGGRVLVRFAKITSLPCRVQISAHFAYDTWHDAIEVPVGSSVIVLDSEQHGGTRIRLAWDDAHGERKFGATHFVVDPSRIMQRAADATASTRSHVSDPFLIITDPRLADLWLSGLSQLAAAQAQIALPVATSGGVPRGESDATPTPGKFLPDDEHSWLTYQDDAKARLGPAMFAFALGGMAAVHALGRTTAALTLQLPTDVLVDEAAAGLDDDDAEIVNDETDARELDPGPSDANNTAGDSSHRRRPEAHGSRTRSPREGQDAHQALASDPRAGTAPRRGGSGRNRAADTRRRSR